MRLPASLAVMLVAAVLAAGDAARPNVVVFLADDLGWGDLGCYGNTVIRTPALDRFAGEGLRLTRCYSAGSVCSPSRSAILTGRAPWRNGVTTWIPPGNGMHLRRSEVTSATLLRAAGYATCHVGKWHLNGLFNDPGHPQPDDHGFDWWLATQNNAAPSHRDPINFVRNRQAVGPMNGYSALLVVDEAVRWLREHRDRAKPFYLNVWTHEPHLPIAADPRFSGLYPEIAAKDPQRAKHHGDVSQLDSAFGALMQALDELGLARDTLVVFTSDNGPEGQGSGLTSGSTGGLRGRKRAMYEGGIRVPGIVRFPGRVRPGKSAVPVIGSDLFATVCAFAGVTPPAGRVLDGVDLSPLLLRGEAPARPIPMYWRYDGAIEPLKCALAEGDWKILADAALTRFELYDLTSDPAEQNDLAAKDPARLAAMRARLSEVKTSLEAESQGLWPAGKGKGGVP